MNRDKKMMRNGKRLKDWKKKTGWFKPRRTKEDEERREEVGQEARRKEDARKEERKAKPRPPTNNMKTPTSVLFIPRTNGGELLLRMREAEEKLEGAILTRVRLVEKCGTQLKDLLIKGNPWEQNPCKFKNCRVCDLENPEETPRCGVRNIL